MDDDDLLRLDAQVCFALAVASRKVIGLYGPLLGPMGLTHPQYLVMLALWEESPRRQSDLARSVHLEPATLSPLVARLERSGYVKRVHAASDERVRLVELTSAGRALRAEALAIPPSILRILDMDAEELASLRDTLHDLIDRADAAERHGGDSAGA
ncbi:MarR family winged helix-turn-helix transcriptional regulator [Brevibacterium album]|uniref:MarR family winged helix-turn-helix transcriptional regulator n=1 Tax=Brevibacterium album TaxID=417948 RepID=UPI000554917A|nr:MarR family transcriptional regulator [Brevibacterium album]